MSGIIKNNVFKAEEETMPLSLTDLAYEANLVGGKIMPSDYPSRIQGKLCRCSNGGEFVLLPLDDPGVIEGGKRYMQCRKCGEYSHL